MKVWNWVVRFFLRRKMPRELKPKEDMQRELDKYFFFYAVWFDDTVPEEEYPLFYNWDVHLTMFIFPISTERQLEVLKKNGTKNSQVGAFEKTTNFKDLFWNDFSNDGGHYACYWHSTKATEALVKALKERKTGKIFLRKKVFSFIRDLTGREILNLGSSPAPHFSSQKTMQKLLQTEHKVLRGFSYERLFMVKPKNYGAMENFFKEKRAENLAWCVKNGVDIEEDEGFERTGRAYAALSKSLFRPRWQRLKEVKTDQDYKELSDF